MIAGWLHARAGPAVTFSGRPRPAAVDPTPGPLDYDQPATLGKGGPAFTMQGRLEPKQGSDAPAPGEYDLPVAWRTGPALTMRARVDPKPSKEKQPGEAAGCHRVLGKRVDWMGRVAGMRTYMHALKDACVHGCWPGKHA